METYKIKSELTGLETTYIAMTDIYDMPCGLKNQKLL